MRREAISFWPKSGQFRLLGCGAGESSAGDIDFIGEKRGQENPDDNRASARGNNDFDAWSLRIDSALRCDARLVRTATDNTINAYGGTARLKFWIPGNRFSVEANYSATTEQFHPVETLPEPENGPDRWRRTVMIALGGDAYLIASRWWSRAFFIMIATPNEFGGETFHSRLPLSAEDTAHRGPRRSNA